MYIHHLQYVFKIKKIYIKKISITHGGAIPIACRLANATKLGEPAVLKGPRMPGFMANCDWMRAWSSAALRAFSMASFMKLAAWEGPMDDAPPAPAPTVALRSRDTERLSICDCGVGRGTR